jgi:hypothetical protein
MDPTLSKELRCSFLGPLQLLITLFLRGLTKEHRRVLVHSQISKPDPILLNCVLGGTWTMSCVLASVDMMLFVASCNKRSRWF